LDRNLAKLISDERRGSGIGIGGPGDLVDRVKEIEREKRALVVQFFNEAVYGVKFSEVFNKLDCLDSWLEFGEGLAFNHNPAFEFGTEATANDFEKGKQCQQQLEAALHASSRVPSLHDALPI